MDDTTKDSASNATKFDMTATLRGLGFERQIIEAFEKAQRWRKSKDNAWRWPSKSDDWFDILGNHHIGMVYGGATKIKQYVFEAPKIPEIRGASAILDRINLVDLRLLWDQQDLTRQMIIYASGGSILGFAPADKAEQLAQDIEQTYTRETLLANSVAVSRTFSLLEVLFGINAHRYGLNNFLDHWMSNNGKLQTTLSSYYYTPDPYPSDARTDENTKASVRFLNRKNFGEIITLLATMANRRREGLGSSTDGNPLRRDIPHYPILPLAQKCQTSDIRAAVVIPRFDTDMLLSESSARKAYAGRFVKKTDTKRTNNFADTINWYFRGENSNVATAKPVDGQWLESWEYRWEAWLHNGGANSPYAQSLPKHQITDVQAAQDVDDIGAASKGRASGFVGMVYADGDRVGQRIATLRTPDEFADFSQRLSDAAEKAVFRALGRHLEPQLKKDEKDKKVLIHPFEILSIGGDDLIILVPGDKALEIATTIAYEFEKKMTDDKTERRVGRYQGKLVEQKDDRPTVKVPNFDEYTPDIGISAGVLVAPEKTPIFFMHKLAEELQKNAKKLSKAKQSGGAIDFMILRSITMVTDRVDTFRYNAYGVGKPSQNGISAEFTARPFLWRELAGLIKTTGALKIAELRRSQLYRINEVIQNRDTPNAIFPSILEFLYISARQDKSVKDILEDLRQEWLQEGTEIKVDQQEDPENPAIPWLKNTRETKKHGTIAYWETFWPDIVEIYDFVAQKEQPDA